MQHFVIFIVLPPVVAVGAGAMSYRLFQRRPRATWLVIAVLIIWLVALFIAQMVRR